MFKKNKCKNCGERINSKHSFCPSCGFNLNENSKKEDWGMLGKNDSLEESDPFSSSLFGKMTGGIMNKMINSAMKMMEKEMQKDTRNQKDFPKTNFKLMINGKEIPLNQVQQKQIKKQEKKIETKKLPMFSDEKRKQFQKLKRQEPKTNLKRIGNKVIYEVEIPEVNSLDNISVLRLENSIEIKAIGKNKAYEKIIQISSPMTDYSLLKDNLVLEFKGN